jgi:hypothetical protein
MFSIMDFVPKSLLRWRMTGLLAFLLSASPGERAVARDAAGSIEWAIPVASAPVAPWPPRPSTSKRVVSTVSEGGDAHSAPPCWAEGAYGGVGFEREGLLSGGGGVHEATSALSALSLSA